MEMPVPETEADVDDDGYGNLVTSEDNPWKLDTTGAPHLAEMTSSLDNGNSRSKYAGSYSFGRSDNYYYCLGANWPDFF